MPSYTDIYPERWLHADHLQNRDVTITIAKVHKEEVYNQLTKKKEPRLAASFPGKDKLLAINKTNARALAEIAGTDDYDQWRNLRVVLSPARAPNGKPTILIRAPSATSAPVHGRQEPMLHGQVHGPTDMAMHGQAALQEPQQADWEEEESDLEMEDQSASADPKSAGARLAPGDPDADVLFFTPSELSQKIRNLHLQSSEPMTVEQHDYIEKMLHGFAPGKESAAIWQALTKSEITRENRAGALVGRYLYDLMREDERSLPHETEALRALCQRL